LCAGAARDAAGIPIRLSAVTEEHGMYEPGRAIHGKAIGDHYVGACTTASLVEPPVLAEKFPPFRLVNGAPVAQVYASDGARIRHRPMSGGQLTSDRSWAVSGPSETAQWRPVTATNDSRSERQPQVTRLDLRHWYGHAKARRTELTCAGPAHREPHRVSV
jgi:hypothetical protein